MIRLGTNKAIAFVLLGVYCSLLSCDVISSDSEADQLKEQIIFTSNRSASNTPGELALLEGATIHRMNPDGSGVVQLTELRSPNESHFGPSISPNGESIAFSVRIVNPDSANEWYVFKSRYDGTNLEKVAGNGDRIVNPRWSPTDSRIAFGSNRYGDYDIFTVKSSGNPLVQITNNDATDMYPTWSPDGNKIAFASDRGGNLDIYVKNLENEELMRITSDDGDDTFPRWSPDGSKIAFTSDRDGDDEVFFTDVEGSNITQLTQNEVSDNAFSWSPSGEKITITTHRDGNIDVFKIDAAGRENPVNLSNNPATDWKAEWGRIKVSN